MQPDEIFQELDRSGRKAVHFIGVGGIGLSALARWFLTQNWAVSGSDLEATELTRELAEEGVKTHIGHQKGLPRGASLIIRSQAVRPDNPEYAAARRSGIPVLTYPEMVGVLTRLYKTIAIAGAHGKSTTTALAALAAVHGGLNPTVIIGTKLKEFGGSNFRKGKGDWLILEADEFGRAFLHYSPFALLITNIDREHLDIYSGLADLKKTFVELIGRVAPGGILVLNKDNANLFSLRSKIKNIVRKHDLRILWYSEKQRDAAAKIRNILKIPGRHNLSNALGAASGPT